MQAKPFKQPLAELQRPFENPQRLPLRPVRPSEPHRANGHTWHQIAHAFGTSPDTAQLRFDPESPIADSRRS